MIQIEGNIVKNPKLPGGNLLVIYKRRQGFELKVTMRQIQLEVKTGLEPGTDALRDKTQTTWPRWFLGLIF